MDDAGPDSVRLLDDQTFETVDRYGLEPTEMCCSIASMSFAEDPASYYVIGTALTVAEEPEPTKVRLLPPFSYCLGLLGVSQIWTRHI